MKSKEELTSNVNYSESLKSQLSKRHIQLINMLDKKEPSCYVDIADIIIEQTAELQQDVERLKGALEKITTIIEVTYPLYFSSSRIYQIATKALNPQQYEKTETEKHSS